MPKVTLPLSRVFLCRVSSLLATDGCGQAGMAYEDALPYDLVPKPFCTEHAGYRAPPPQVHHSQGRGLLDRIRGWFR